MSTASPRASTNREIAHYFEYSNHGIEVEADGLQEIPFGEFLVEKGYLDREQLFRALCEQDRQPGIRFGEIVAALGFLPYPVVDVLLTQFCTLAAVEA